MFSRLSRKTKLKTVSSSSSKSCDLDALPGQLIKNCVFTLLPIEKIANLSLESGYMPTVLKEAMLKRLLKISSLNPDGSRNYRPISKKRVFRQQIYNT